MEVLSIQQHARDTLSRLRMRKRDKNWARDHMKHHTRTAGLRAGLHGKGLDWAARGWGWAARGVCWLLAAQGWVTAGLGCWLHRGGCTRAVQDWAARGGCWLHRGGCARAVQDWAIWTEATQGWLLGCTGWLLVAGCTGAGC
ncbi:hypothetical protein Acr_00g0051890 [Actinidia rufa]|uniref:Uncharacterized protein n=1 Tax=Actinidia rufa TaxID=165716 RepID=A0A7J0DKY0_9ERIC|nr:hypothetical protein Acr_00g0051890 [Actinidia rufa]